MAIEVFYDKEVSTNNNNQRSVRSLFGLFGQETIFIEIHPYQPDSQDKY